VVTEDRDEDVLDDSLLDSQGEVLATHPHDLVLHGEVLPRLPPAGIRGTNGVGDDRGHRVVLIAGHQVAPGLDDADLLAGNRSRGVAKLWVVTVDGGDDADLAADEVRGVPPAAHADLEDADVDGHLREPRKSHGREQLEVGDVVRRVRVRLVDEPGQPVHHVQLIYEDVLGDEVAIGGNTLAHVLEMGRGVRAHAQVQHMEQPADHPHDRTLAIGPGDVDRRVGVLGIGQQVAEGGDAVEVGKHPTPAPFVEPRHRVVEPGQSALLDLLDVSQSPQPTGR
jgi:hypothetical protein